MERVSTLIYKLQQQLSANADAGQLLQTAQMLYSELLLKKSATASHQSEKISVLMPAVTYQPAPEVNQEVLKNIETKLPSYANIPQEEKIVEVLQVDEKEIEEELEEMKRNAESKNSMSLNAKPQLLFDPLEDVPTLTHQQPAPVLPKEINENSSREPESINERLRENRTEVVQRLKEEPIRDLKKGIGVNDRFLFINELFRGDEAMYERSIKTINNFSILAEAEYWIRRELKVKIGWKDSDPFVKQFDQLVRRRFF